MPTTSSGDEDLIRQLPLPLAQLYRRARNARTDLERHQAAYYCWEAGLKLLGATAVLEYVERGQPEPQLTERLACLARPSLGQWWEVARELIARLAEPAEGPFRRLKETLLGPARPDLPATSALDSSLRALVKPGAPTTGPVKLRDLFDRLVRYRNDELGHGPLGMRSDDFYGRMSDALLAALPELFGAVDVLAGRRLAYVSDVSRDASGRWVIERLELVGETARRLPPLRLCGGAESLPVPKRLYLFRPEEDVPSPATLHPLVVYDEATRSVYFLNSQRGRDEAEYLDYVDGKRLVRDDLAEDHRTFLAAVLAEPVEAADLKNPDESNPVQEAVAPTVASRVAAGEAGPRVVLLYKRNVQPDEQLLLWLEQELTARGARVFVDRHLSIGVEWGKELERRVREADAVLLLLSAASVQSEMLAYEVQIAHDEGQKRGGLPRVLPVRVHYDGPLPPELAGILNRLQYFLWQGPADNKRLLAELLAAFGAPPPPLKAVPPPAGALPLDSTFYVVRPTDAEFQAAVDRRDSVILIRGARQMGKTSLLARGLEQARARGDRLVVTDFQKLNAGDFQSVEVFFRTLGQWIADELGLSAGPEAVWQPHRGPSVNFERYLRRQILEPHPGPLVLALDEADRLFGYPFASEVFGLFRSWHNARVLDPLWSRLTLVITYATEAHLFITDLNQSPFNVGTLLSLEDFTPEQVRWLNERYGGPLRNADELDAFYRLVGGHPYLTNRGLYQLARHGPRAVLFADEAAREDGVFGDHLRRILVLLARDTELCDVVRGVLRGRGCPSTESFYRLRSAGVLAGESARAARMRCELYARYLERHLL
jgi:hypothetical protein